MLTPDKGCSSSRAKVDQTEILVSLGKRRLRSWTGTESNDGLVEMDE